MDKKIIVCGKDLIPFIIIHTNFKMIQTNFIIIQTKKLAKKYLKFKVSKVYINAGCKDIEIRKF